MTHWPFPGLSPGKYRALLIDNPWKFNGGTKGRPQHYRRMTDVQLAALPVYLLAHPDGCNVFVCVTSPMFKRAMDIFHQWNPPGARAKDCIRYSSRALLWIKTHRKLGRLSPPMFVHPQSLHFGQGYTTRKNAEDVWLFKYGRPKRISKKVHEPVISPAREHSRKPDEFYERIEAYCDGPYAELFSRCSRPGWDAWGDEVGKFTSTAA